MHELSIGETLVRAREKKQLRQITLCRKANIAPSRLSRLECGRRYPSQDEWLILDAFLDLGPFRHPPDEPSPPAVWKPVLPNLNRTSQATLASRAYGARRVFGPLVDQALKRVLARDDADVVEHFLQQACLDSSIEYWLSLDLLANGAQPYWMSPLRAGYRAHSVIDRETQQVAGDIRHPCLGVAIDGGSLLIFPQVSVQTRKGLFRLDALVCVRIGRTRFWVNLEIDGGGHDSTFDRERQAALGLETIRLNTADLQVPDVLAVIELKLAVLLKAQVA